MDPRIVKSQLCSTRGIYSALLKAEMDLAFLYLRLAATESELGATALAADLLEGAILAHKNVTRHLQHMPVGMDDSKPDLQSGACSLLQAIVATEQQLQVLQIRPRPQLCDGGGSRPGLETTLFDLWQSSKPH